MIFRVLLSQVLQVVRPLDYNKLWVQRLCSMTTVCLVFFCNDAVCALWPL